MVNQKSTPHMPLLAFSLLISTFLVIGSADASIRYEHSLQDDESQGPGNPYSALQQSLANKDIQSAQSLSVLSSRDIVQDDATFKGRNYTVREASGGASRVKSGTTIRESIEKDTLLMEGDRITVPGGSKIQLTLDSTWDNVLEIEGPTELDILSIQPHQLFVQKGKLVTVLDNNDAFFPMTLFTPRTSARITGTRFLTTVNNQMTKYVVYEGSLEVQGRDYASGDRLFNYRTLPQGNTLILSQNRDQNETVRAMTYDESIQIEQTLKSIEANRPKDLPANPTFTDAPPATTQPSQYRINENADKYIF